MKTDTSLNVIDARQAYLRWNTSQYERLYEITGNDSYKNIQLIPLMLQVNNRLLPGYVDIDSPVGVFSYKPDKNTINNAKALNSRFRYNQEGVINNYVIEAVYFKNQIIDKSKSCWIFYRASLNSMQISMLKDKVNKISQWFSSRGEKIDFIFLSVDEFRDNKVDELIKTNKSLYLDEFYSEAILLAGKYPVWWLVPPNKEKEYVSFIEHIKHARFVDIEEFVDLGSAAELAREDIIKYSVELVQKVKKSPEICLVKLLLVDKKNSSWPEIEGVSFRIKRMIYKGETSINPVDVVGNVMREVFNNYVDQKHILSPVRLFSRIRNVPGKLNLQVVDSFLQDDYVHESASKGLENIISYLNFFKAVSHEVRQIFSNIVVGYDTDHGLSESDNALASVARNMLFFLSDADERVPLYNSENRSDIILNRIHLKQENINEADVWSLVLEVSEGNERTIEGFSSLLGLLAWCWLNRVVNHSTQVSIDCPGKQVKQIEAYFVLETLIQQLNPELISNIPAVAYENSVRPLQSLLFVNFMSTSSSDNNYVTVNDDPLNFGLQSKNLVTHCEQLIVNSWGDVYTKQYSGNMGILKCLCDWSHHAPLDGLAKPQQLMVFGHGAGDSTYMAQRIEQVYQEIISFFYYAKHESGRFILRMGSCYYAVVIKESLLLPYEIGNKNSLVKYLEAPSVSFNTTELERLAYPDFPLREIYQNNKPHVLQIFFQIISRNCNCWIFDEKGSLWSDVLNVYDRESYIIHWLYFYRNIRNRLKKINYQDREFPSLEISQINVNQLGGIDFYTVGPEAITGRKKYLDLQVSIVGHNNGDQLSLVCDGRNFDYNVLQQNVLIECVQYMSARMTGEGVMPVYVTDIDVPLRLFNVEDRDEIQISHILKFKRNFEHRINKLLNG